VLPPDGSLEPLAVNDLGENCYATPAPAGGRIYLRTVTTLYAFGKKGTGVFSDARKKGDGGIF
jgi:hypothetical protein